MYGHVCEQKSRITSIVDGLVYVMVESRRQQIIALNKSGHVHVPEVLVLLFRRQIGKVFTYQNFALATFFAMVTVLAFGAVKTSVVAPALTTSFKDPSWPVVAIIQHVFWVKVVVRNAPFPNNYFFTMSSTSVLTTRLSKTRRNWTTLSLLEAFNTHTRPGELAFHENRHGNCYQYDVFNKNTGHGSHLKKSIARNH